MERRWIETKFQDNKQLDSCNWLTNIRVARPSVDFRIDATFAVWRRQLCQINRATIGSFLITLPIASNARLTTILRENEQIECLQRSLEFFSRNLKRSREAIVIRYRRNFRPRERRGYILIFLDLYLQI